jgi:hypothetical protein
MSANETQMSERKREMSEKRVCVRTGACSEDDDAPLLQVPHGAPADVGLSHLLHVNRLQQGEEREREERVSACV